MMPGFRIFILLFIASQVHASMLHDIFNDLCVSYKRPITILYISHDPEWLPIADKHSMVLWSDHLDLCEYLQRKNSSNHILLTGAIVPEHMISLAECEHFDIAIIDINIDPLLFFTEAHLADFTIIVSSEEVGSLKKIGEENNQSAYLLDNPKKLLKKNWWKSCSFHSNYIIKSTFSDKYLIKPAEYTKDNKQKLCRWRPGINVLTFHNLGGAYPSKSYIREEIISLFNPLTHWDFGAANIIIQGKRLKAIDYNDTIYGEDPYERLKRTLEVQLSLKYE